MFLNKIFKIIFSSSSLVASLLLLASLLLMVTLLLPMSMFLLALKLLQGFSSEVGPTVTACVHAVAGAHAVAVVSSVVDPAVTGGP
jgi:hypothetical protein